MDTPFGCICFDKIYVSDRRKLRSLVLVLVYKGWRLGFSLLTPFEWFSWVKIRSSIYLVVPRWYSVRSSTVHNSQVDGAVGFPVRSFLFKRLFNSQLAGTPIVCTQSRLNNSCISQLFHLEIHLELNTDFLAKSGLPGRKYLQSLVESLCRLWR